MIVGYKIVQLSDGYWNFHERYDILWHVAQVARVFVFSYRGRTKTWATQVNSKKCPIFQQQRIFVSFVPKEGRNNVIRHRFCNENIHPSCPSFRPGPSQIVLYLP